MKVNFPHGDNEDYIWKRIEKNCKDEKNKKFFFDHDILSNDKINQFEYLRECIEKLCIPEESILNLKLKLFDMEIQRLYLQAHYKTHNKFPTCRLISNYLDEYIRFCGKLFSCPEIFDDGEAKSMRLFEELLCLDVTNDKKDVLYVSMYSPFSLAALRNIYVRVWGLVTNGEYINYINTYADNFIDDIIINKIIRNFERYYIYNNNLYVTTIIDNNDNPLNAITGYKWRNLSSIVPIEIVDLYEKIYNFIMRNIGDERSLNNKIKIGIFGYSADADNSYAHVTSLKQLYDYLIFSTKKEQIRITLDLILNKKDVNAQTNNPDIRIKGIDYTDGTFSRKFSKYINEYDLLFILDAPQLYKSDLDYATEIKIDEFARKLQGMTYESNYNKLKPYFGKIGILSEIGDQLIFSSLNKEKMHGFVRHELRAGFINLLKDVVSTSTKCKEIYLFISDEKNVDISSYDRLNATTLENKNGKNIALIRIGNTPTKKLNTDGCHVLPDNDKISFNLWNLVKNIAPSLRNTIFAIKDSDKWVPAIKELENIEINLEWDYIPNVGPSNFKILWRFKKDENGKSIIPEFKLFYDKKVLSLDEKKEMINKMICSLFEIIFSLNDNFAFKCVRKCFGNIFMGRLTTLQQLMTLHMLSKNKFKLKSCDYSDIFDYNIIYSFDIIDKRMYYEIINKLDDDNVSLDEIMYNVNRPRINNESNMEVINNIRNMCKKLNYTSATLYKYL